jgi:hypothetical protein
MLLYILTLSWMYAASTVACLLTQVEEQKRRAEADKLAALTALENASAEFMREKQEKKELEAKIAAMQVDCSPAVCPSVHVLQMQCHAATLLEAYHCCVVLCCIPAAYSCAQ